MNRILFFLASILLTWPSWGFLPFRNKNLVLESSPGSPSYRELSLDEKDLDHPGVSYEVVARWVPYRLESNSSVEKVQRAALEKLAHSLTQSESFKKKIVGRVEGQIKDLIELVYPMSENSREPKTQSLSPNSHNDKKSGEGFDARRELSSKRHSFSTPFQVANPGGPIELQRTFPILCQLQIFQQNLLLLNETKYIQFLTHISVP